LKKSVAVAVVAFQVFLVVVLMVALALPALVVEMVNIVTNLCRVSHVQKSVHLVHAASQVVAKKCLHLIDYL